MTRTRRRALALLLAVATIAAACTSPPDPDAPSGTLAIESGRVAIDTTEVTLQITGTDAATSVLVANGDDPTTATAQPLDGDLTLPWSLPSGDGDKIVSAQFLAADGSASPVVLATILLDTVPPEVAITSAVDGEAVDLTDGELYTLDGTATDDGSGVAGVDVSTIGGDFSTALVDDHWTRPVAAPTAGLHTFAAVATDAAGNTARAEIDLDVVLPGPDETVVRPDVLAVEGTLQDALLDDGEDGQSVTFSGDQRGSIGPARTLVSGPSTASENGLMRRVLGVDYDADNDRTIVTSELASVVDVFAQLRIDTLVPAGNLAPGAGLRADADCDTFPDGRTIGGTFDLPELGGSFSLPPLHPSNYSATVSADAAVAAYFDFVLDVDFGWGGVDVNEFSAVAGVLVCGEFEVLAEASTEVLLGPQWDVGLPFTDAEAQLGFANPSLLGVGWTPFTRTNQLERFLPPLNPLDPDGAKGFLIAPSFPIPLYWAPSLTLGPIFEGETSAEASTGGDFAFGGRVGIQGTTPFVEPIVDGSARTPYTSVGTDLSIGVQARAGVRFGEALLGVASAAGQLADAGFAARASVTPTWRDDTVGIASWVERIDLSVCPEFQASAGLDLSVRISAPGPIPGNIRFDIISVDVAQVDIPLGDCLYENSWTWDSPLRIATVTVPNATIDLPYSTELEAAGAPVDWQIISGSLPIGLSLDDTSGTIEGTATILGRSDFTVEATDAGGVSVTKDLTIDVVEPAFNVTTDALPDAATGIEYSETLTADSGSVEWAIIDGSLPPGLSLSPGGQLAGIPEVDGSFTFTVMATRPGGNATARELTLDVVLVPFEILTTDLVNAFDGLLYRETLESNADQVTWALPDDDLPAGLTLSPDGAISGTPEAPGVTVFTAQAIKPTGETVEKDLTLTVLEPIDGIPDDRIAPGWWHSCGISSDSSVKCWGDNGDKGLGNGTTDASSVPVAVAGISGAVSVTTNYEHACAALTDGSVRCWGDNSLGQLGDGTTDTGLTPATVSGIGDAVAVAAGQYHACALRSDGTVSCWGGNGLGQLGIGNAGRDGGLPFSTTPMAVPSLSNVVAISADRSHSCAVLADGTGRCWGNEGGGLENPSAIVSSPITVPGLYGAVGVASGYADYSCALIADGTVSCWGASPHHGQPLAPVSTVPGIDNARSISAGHIHLCVTNADGSASCLGENGLGELGDGTTVSRTLPAPVAGLSTAVGIGAGETHSCAVLADGSARCWGYNEGALGNGGTENSATPVEVTGF